MRRSQLTVFMVFGLILLILVALMVALYESQTDRLWPKLQTQYEIRNTIEPVQRYVEACIEQVSGPHIRSIAENGGTLQPRTFRWYQGAEYNYFCMQEAGSCASTLLLREDMERELAGAIADNLSACIDAKVFERQGFTVETGSMKVNVTVGRTATVVRLHYPISLYKEGMDLSVADYQVDVAAPLGLLYDLAVEIANAENTRSDFDQVNYMRTNGNEIHIDKHKPYPDIVYSLVTEGLEFRFALQGQVSAMSESSVSALGCCYNLYDKSCFKNAPAELCLGKKGIFDYNPSCLCPETASTNVSLCDGRQCRDCEHTYDYVTKTNSQPMRRHGESWCSYESLAGKGYDYVGSRHYRHYCIDGNEYVEECRDYRDELCTEETVSVGGKPFSNAACRINRWEDCASCTTEQCCKDVRFRDCDWKSWLTTDKRCVPYVPPGFRFWEGSGREVCMGATMTKECSGFSCPNIWVDDAAMYCYMQGDCGNYRNVNDDLTKQGYFNSDLHDMARDYVYLKPGNTKEGSKQTITLGISNRRQAPLLDSSVDEFHDNLVQLMTGALRFVDAISSLSVSDILKSGTSSVHVMDVAVCDLWQPPSGGASCARCGSDPYRPCTEYQCRSLGKLCEYEDVRGFPRCYVRTGDDKISPVIAVESVSIGHSMVPDLLSIEGTTYRGYKISPAYRPYELMTLKINTSEDTTCRMSYVPRLKYLSLPSFYFGDARLGRQHNITVRLPERIEIPRKLLDLFNLTQATDLIALLEEPNQFIATYQSRYSQELSMYQTLTGKDIVSMIAPYVDRITKAIGELTNTLPFYRELLRKLIGEFDQGTYYLFIECADRAGNSNANEVYIRFTINDTDAEPPHPLGFRPANMSLVPSETDILPLRMFLDEPAECRFANSDMSYDSMIRSFTCPVSRYVMSANFGGSYECTANLNLTALPVFIRCMDNPSMVRTYRLQVQKALVPGVKGAPASEFLNVTAPARIIASAAYLQEGISFSVMSDNVELAIYTDDLMNCSLSTGNLSVAFSECKNTSAVRRGLYECRTQFQLLDTGVTSESLTVNLAADTDPNNQVGLEIDGTIFRINRSLSGSDLLLHSIDPVTLEVSFDQPTQCVGMDCSADHCSAMLTPGSTETYVCTELAESGVFHGLITCSELSPRPRNVNMKSVSYVVARAPPLEIIDIQPVGEITTQRPVISVETSYSNGTVCGYYEELSLGTIRMQKVNATYHTATVDAKNGTNTLFITCRDDWGNRAEKQVDFFVIA
jgi:hypothetical protein